MDFSNQKVLITGGSRGIGRATALAFAERGAQVAINYRSNAAAAAETLALLPGEGHLHLQADISQAADIEKLVREVSEAFGRIDVLVNNAGVFLPHPIASTSFGDWQSTWQEVMAINLFGAAHVTHQVVQQMLQQGGGGRIVNISSRGAFRGEPDNPAYAASKAGLNAMSQSLAKALAPQQIFVGVVAPGFVETEMAKSILEGPEGAGIKAQSPLGRVAKPAEVAWAVLFLASEKSRFSTGSIIDVNGASYLRS